MATVLDNRSGQQYDEFLDAQLLRARRQVRQADLINGLLKVVCLTAGFAIVMMIVDRAVELSPSIRQIAFGGWLLATAWLMFRYVARPVLSAVNPYYTARQVERLIPESKNSVVNWLDLRDKPLAPVIHKAVSMKAAEQLREADVEEAVRDRGASVWGIIAGLLLVSTVALLLMFRPTQFFSLLRRTFAPFSKTAIAQQTTIAVLEPVGGDAMVPIHHPADIRVSIAGRVPRADEADAARIKIRYNSEDPSWEERKLEATERNSEWSIRIPSTDVRNGFEYQVAASDAESPIHRIGIRAKALVTDFEVHYRYRPYLNFTDDIRTDPNLQAVRGTEVTLVARANRAIKAGVLRLKENGESNVVTNEAALSAERPDMMRFQLTLLKDAQYRLQFVSADGERSDETLPYDIRVLADQPPQVEISQETPEKMPFNGTLLLGSRATDDFGLTKLRLILKLKTAPDGFAESLPTVHHRDGQPWKLPDGTWPRSEHMKEVIALEKLHDLAGRPIVLRAGMQIVYQFQAEDNCDLPKPQLGKSKEVVVTLTDPQPEEQRDTERQQAQNEKKQHDSQQEQERNNSAQPKDNNQKPGEDGKPGDEQPKVNDKPDSPMNPQDQKTIDQAKKLADALNKKNDAQQQPDRQPHEQKTNDVKPNEDQPKQQPDMKQDQPGQPDGKAQPKSEPNKNSDPTQGNEDKGNPQEQKGAGQKPDQVNNDPQQRANNKSGGQDQKEKNPDQMKPGSKSGDNREPKPGEKSEKTGEKSRPGPKQDQPSDQPAQKSPDRGNSDKGQPGTQRSDANPKADGKEEKPTETAMGGKADPKAPNPDKGQSKGATDDQAKNQKPDGKAQPDQGKGQEKTSSGQPGNDKAKTEDAPKPHDQPGEKPKTEPKTDGAPSAGKSNEQKQPGSEPKPENVQKLIDEFNKADPETQRKIVDKLKEMSKSAPTPQERKAAEEAAKDCQGQCDNPGSSPKPGDTSAGGKASDKPGDQSASGKTGEKGKEKSGTKTGNEAAMKPGDKSGKAGNKEGEQSGTTGDKPGQPDQKDGPPKDGSDGKSQAKKPGEKSGDGKGDQVGTKKPDQPGEKSDGPGSGKASQPGVPDGNRQGDPSDGPQTNDGRAQPPNEKFLREAGELQLDEFRKKVDRKLLEELNITEEEYQKFLNAFQELVKRSKENPRPDANEKVRGAADGGSSANNKVKKVEAGPKTGPKTDRGGRGTAPPEFRDQYREFTEEQSKQSKSGKP